jgi:hypothetical protein
LGPGGRLFEPGHPDYIEGETVSASEKLRALGPMTTKNEHGITISKLTLGQQLEATLPHLLSVVEAAENEMRMMVKPPRGKFPTDDALRDALAALDKALS